MLKSPSDRNCPKENGNNFDPYHSEFQFPTSVTGTQLRGFQSFDLRTWGLELPWVLGHMMVVVVVGGLKLEMRAGETKVC